MTADGADVMRTRFPSFPLSIGEWTVMTRLLEAKVSAPGSWSVPSRRAVEEAEQSLRERRALSGTRVNTDLAAIMFSLARPRTACWVHSHRETRPRAMVAVNRRVCAAAWTEGDHVRVAPSTPRHVHSDLALLSGLSGTSVPDGHDSFSVAGGLWHELVTQAPAASDRALQSLALAEGVAEERVARLTALATAHTERVDLRVARPRNIRSWSGNEISFIRVGPDVWSVADGRGFDDSGSRASSRAVFTRVNVGELLAGVLSS